MEQKLINELKAILKSEKGNLYGFVCEHYYELTKDELKDLCKEAFALLYENQEKDNFLHDKPIEDFKGLHLNYFEALTDNTTIFEE